MSEAAATADVLERFFELFDDGTDDHYGTERYLGLVSESCDWAEFSSESRFAGRCGDKAALRAGAATSGETLRNRHAVIAERFVDEDRAVVIWTWSATERDSQTLLRAEVVSVFTVRDGLIVRWHDRISS